MMKQNNFKSEKCLTCKDRYECITKKYEIDELRICDYKDLINQLNEMRIQANKKIKEDKNKTEEQKLNEEFKHYIKRNIEWKIKEQ